MDWSNKGWQQVWIPLDSLVVSPVEAITAVVMQGGIKGSFLLDAVRLTVIATPPTEPSGTAVEETCDAALPKAMALAQNYRNPFNSKTVIRFALPTREQVDLALYDLAGQRVVALASGTRAAGTYTLTWDGRDEAGRPVATGVFLYGLQAARRLEARRLLLLH